MTFDSLVKCHFLPLNWVNINANLLILLIFEKKIELLKNKTKVITFQSIKSIWEYKKLNVVQNSTIFHYRTSLEPKTKRTHQKPLTWDLFEKSIDTIHHQYFSSLQMPKLRQSNKQNKK